MPFPSCLRGILGTKESKVPTRTPEMYWHSKKWEVRLQRALFLTWRSRDMKCAPRQSVFVGNNERAAAGEQKCKKQGVTANSRKQRIICLYKNENEDKLTTEVWLGEKKKKENTRTVSRMTGKGPGTKMHAVRCKQVRREVRRGGRSQRCIPVRCAASATVQTRSHSPVCRDVRRYPRPRGSRRGTLATSSRRQVIENLDGSRMSSAAPIV